METDKYSFVSYSSNGVHLNEVVEAADVCDCRFESYSEPFIFFNAVWLNGKERACIRFGLWLMLVLVIFLIT